MSIASGSGGWGGSRTKEDMDQVAGGEQSGGGGGWGEQRTTKMGGEVEGGKAGLFQGSRTRRRRKGAHAGSQGEGIDTRSDFSATRCSIPASVMCRQPLKESSRRLTRREKKGRQASVTRHSAKLRTCRLVR